MSERCFCCRIPSTFYLKLDCGCIYCCRCASKIKLSLCQCGIKLNNTLIAILLRTCVYNTLKEYIKQEYVWVYSRILRLHEYDDTYIKNMYLWCYSVEENKNLNDAYEKFKLLSIKDNIGIKYKFGIGGSNYIIDFDNMTQDAENELIVSKRKIVNICVGNIDVDLSLEDLIEEFGKLNIVGIMGISFGILIN